jgi:hypothetical protein
MQVITVGKRLIPAEQIVFVEPFDPASNPQFMSDKPFKGRVVLLNRDTVLTVSTPEEFAEARGLHLLADDGVAVSHALAFRVEIFTPTETFNPDKAYRTRLKWQDLEGNTHSKLLASQPETVIAELSRREPAPVRRGELARRPARKRRSSQELRAARS